MKKIVAIHFLVVNFLLFVVTGLYAAEEPPLSHEERQFFESASLGKLAQIKEYLEKGGDINRISGGLNALHIASWKDKKDVVEYLLDNGIDGNLQDHSGRTALHYAIEADRLAVIHVLLNRDDINLDLKDDRGRTPLLAAARAGKFDIALKLLKKGADVNAVNTTGQNIFHVALDNGQIDFVRSFVELSSDIVSANVKRTLKYRNDSRGQYPVDYLDLSDPREVVLQNLLSVSPKLVGHLEELSSQVQELGQREVEVRHVGIGL